MCSRLTEHLTTGDEVVLDHVLWFQTDRDARKKLVEAAGGRWRLVYLPVDRDKLLRRLADRNRREDANALTVTASALDDFFARFEPPAHHEHAIIHAGDPTETCTAVLHAEQERGGRPGVR
ncbi:AAA family ATPase [Streptomyces klenkii]|uniref:AAA family ATPase n=1 Tax=Streptomyces klenkii TaxID=1420899 RepID=UPI00343E97D9